MDSSQRYLIEEELEHYRDGWTGRREFIRRATLLGAGAAAAAAMAQTVVPGPRSFAAPVAQRSPFSVPADDPAVSAEWVSYTSTDGATLAAYLATPSDAQADHSLPGVVICHANRGITEHVMDVARRFAKQGYVALATDLPSRSGRRSIDYTDQSELLLAFGNLNSQQNALDFSAGLDYLGGHPAVDANRLAATGYCFGGGVIWRLATIAPNLRAAAPFYGSNPPLEDVSHIRAAMFGVYGGLDDRLNAGIPALETAAGAAGVTYQIKIYPNSPHGFHDDTGSAYNPDTAPQAWMDTLNWFARYLELPPPSSG